MLASIGDTFYGVDGIIYDDQENGGIYKMTVSTQLKIPDIPAPVGRPRINGEQTMARFRAGTLARINAVLSKDEKKSDFIRDAVERELQQREARTKS